MTSPSKLLPAIGLGFLASSLIPEEQPATAAGDTKAPEAPAPVAPASSPSTSKPKAKSPSFLSGASLLPPPGTATQGKTLLGQ